METNEQRLERELNALKGAYSCVLRERDELKELNDWLNKRMMNWYQPEIERLKSVLIDARAVLRKHDCDPEIGYDYADVIEMISQIDKVLSR